MPPKVNKNIYVFVVDVGLYSIKSMNPEDTSYLEKAKQIIINLIKKMIFISPNDEVAIICYGSNEVGNLMNYNYDNVKIHRFADVDWDLIKTVENLKSGQATGNFINGIAAALHYLDIHLLENSSSYKYNEKHIYYFYNCLDKVGNHPCNYKKITDKITETIKMWCIGENTYDNLKKEMKHDPALANFINFIKNSCDQYWTMDTLIKESSFVGPKSVNPVPSKITLEYVDIKIPISVFKVIEDEMKKPTFSSEQSKYVEYMNENKETVDKNDIIKAFKIGHKLVPVSDEDQEKMKFNGGEKSLKILGFIRESEITIDNWGMSPARLILPSKECSTNQYTDFYSLCEQMIRKDDAAVVRLVLRNNDAPKVGFLYAIVDEDTGAKSFVFIEMPFEEQRYSQYFKPIPDSFEINSDISDSVQNFIFNTVLMNKNEKKRFFEPGTVKNPSLQVYWDAIAFKIQNPEKPLSELKCSHLFDVLKQPQFVKDTSKDHADKLREVFETYVPVQEKEENATLSQEENTMEQDEQNVKKEEEKMEEDKNKAFFDDDVDFDDITDF